MDARSTDDSRKVTLERGSASGIGKTDTSNEDVANKIQRGPGTAAHGKRFCAWAVPSHDDKRAPGVAPLTSTARKGVGRDAEVQVYPLTTAGAH